MSVRSGQSITVDFTTSKFSTGEATAADSLPAATLVVNGTDDAATVTVTSKTGGKYKAAVTLPTLTVGDIVQLRVAATVDSVAGVGVVWTDQKDIALDSNGKTTDSVQTGDTYALANGVNGFVATKADTAAIKAKADNLPSDPADQSAVEAAITAATSGLATASALSTVAEYLDTEIAAILADTNELQTDWTNGGRLDLILDARASQSSVDTIDDFIDTEITAIKAKTDQFVFTVAGQVDANALSGGGGLDAAGVRTAIGLASANLDTQLADIPTVSEFNARTIAAASYATASVLGTPAGASVAADIAAVKTDTGNLVTRITSTLFSGITSLAQWLGLMAGKQVGNTTARTELRATGAGSGTFDETTDSQEAIGDKAALATDLATANVALTKFTTMVALDGSVYQFTANALELAPGGGNATVSSFAAGALAQLAALDTINVTGAVTGEGVLNLTQGGDYLTTDGRQLQFVNAAGSLPNLTGATPYLVLKNAGTTHAAITGTVITASGVNQRVDFNVSDATTDLLTAPRGSYEVYAVLSNGSVVPLETGVLNVTRKLRS